MDRTRVPGVLIALTSDLTLTNGMATFNSTPENDFSLTVETHPAMHKNPSKKLLNKRVKPMVNNFHARKEALPIL
jgi:hypothetical protein